MRPVCDCVFFTILRYSNKVDPGSGVTVLVTTILYRVYEVLYELRLYPYPAGTVAIATSQPDGNVHIRLIPAGAPTAALGPSSPALVAWVDGYSIGHDSHKRSAPGLAVGALPGRPKIGLQ